jgi:hypothetical protein
MKYLLKTVVISLFFIAAPFYCLADDDDRDQRDIFGRTFFHARSDGSNKARQSAGMGNLITWGYDECSDGVAWTTVEYAQSFNKRDIGKYFFFNGSDTMRTGTSAGPGIDIFGENFLVNDNFNSAITARPHVRNALVDINLFYALDLFCSGFYFMAHIPFVSTSWAVDFKETISSPGTIISANDLGNPVDSPAPFNSMIEAWNGQGTFFDVKQPLQFARIDGRKKKSHLSDIEFALGCIVLDDECNNFSINARVIIPTSNRPKGEFVFEPITGNGHYLEVGAGILGNFFIWDCNCDELLTVFINANIYTMLKSKQMRTFDLKNNGIGSRYLLFKRFNGPTYAGEIVRGPNILTLPIHAKNRVHGDLVFMLEYLRHNLILDLGYNLWGRTRDHIEVIGTIPENTFGIAGLSGTAGIDRNRTASTTQINGTNATVLDPVGLPIFISNKDLDIESAAHPGAFSHGFFVHIGYLWDINYVQPFVGIGAEVEFSGTNKSLKMGHIWGKVGVSF